MMYAPNTLFLRRFVSSFRTRRAATSLREIWLTLEQLETRNLLAPIAVSPVPLAALAQAGSPSPIAAQAAVTSELVSIFMVYSSTGLASFLLSGPTAAVGGPSGPAPSYMATAPLVGATRLAATPGSGASLPAGIHAAETNTLLSGGGEPTETTSDSSDSQTDDSQTRENMARDAFAAITQAGAATLHDGDLQALAHIGTRA
jgi:hypothetical protein